MEGVVNPCPEFWTGKRVLVLGHTGFKGSWLSLWLRELGASVLGLSLGIPTNPSLFALAGIEGSVPTRYGDIRDLRAVSEAMAACAPEIVFHLAAQPLVRLSYRQPVETYATNVMGTVHILEAIRSVQSVRSVIVVTSDKCYENRERPEPYREDAPMGGFDPYSSSKGCAELVTSAYRRSFLADRKIGIASVRAGNVIGGGDWAEDRLLPDCIRALGAGKKIDIRNPRAVRPWQHVLEPLCGYLILAERLYADIGHFAEAWNFGPDESDAREVSWIVSRVVGLWGAGAWESVSKDALHEAHYLKVDSAKAHAVLGWKPRLDLTQCIDWTVEWYRRQRDGEGAASLTNEQILRYVALEPAHS